MSEFVYLFRSSEAAAREAMSTPAQAQRSLQKWMGWIRELEANGHLKSPGQPLARTGKVVASAKRTVTDGPYAEQDSVLGFIIVEAKDLDEAVALAAGCPVLDGDGSVEVRPVEQAPM